MSVARLGTRYDQNEAIDLTHRVPVLDAQSVAQRFAFLFPGLPSILSFVVIGQASCFALDQALLFFT